MIGQKSRRYSNLSMKRPESKILLISATFITVIHHSQLNFWRLSCIQEVSLKSMIVSFHIKTFIIELKSLPGPHDYPVNEAEFFAPK